MVNQSKRGEVSSRWTYFVLFALLIVSSTHPILAEIATPTPFSAELIKVIENPSSSGRDNFGTHLAVDGNYLIIGARNDDEFAFDSGAVHIYDPETLERLETIHNPTRQAEDHFGSRMALQSGNQWLAVGAYGNDEKGTDSGAVFIYDLTTRQLLKTLYSPSPIEGGNFGAGLEWWGSHLLVGSAGDRFEGTASGVVYQIDVPSGDLYRTISSPDPDEGDYFGRTLALEGDRLLIGARFDDEGGENAGRVYLFSTATGEVLQTFENPFPDPQSNFSAGLALIGDEVLVGALDDDTKGANAGAVYVFSAETGDLLRTIYHPEPRVGARFGAIFPYGRFAFINAPATINGLSIPGSLGLFDPKTGDRLLEINHGVPRDFLGISIAVHEDHLVIGSIGTDSSPIHSGKAYSYRLSRGLLPLPVAIHPESPRTLDDLTCLVGPVELEEETHTVSFEFDWLVNGLGVSNQPFSAATSSSLSHSFTESGDLVECHVTAQIDGELGTWGADSVVIRNSTPTAPVIRLLPENPTPDDGLAVYIVEEAIDPDGDQVVYVFEWFSSEDGVNWIRRPELSGLTDPVYVPGSPEVSALYTRIAQYWKVEVTAYETHIFTKGRQNVSSETIDMFAGHSAESVVWILPDLDEDDELTSDDLLRLLEIWNLDKSEMDPDTRSLFFEEDDPDESRLEPKHLLMITQFGWHGEK